MGMCKCESEEHHYDSDKYHRCPHCNNVEKERKGMIRCDANQHHYDSNKYVSCPHCNKIKSIFINNQSERTIVKMECDEGHIYNIQRYQSCPHCEISPNTIFSPTRSSEIGVIAISDTLVAKVFKDKSDLEKESKNLQFANSINGLFVKFERNIFLKNNNLMIMERVFSLEFRAYEYSKKLEFFNKFQESMNELHQYGFVFRDIMTTYFGGGREFPNIILTHEGIRLIDTELSVLATEVDIETFNEYVTIEKKEIEGYFKEYFLNKIKGK
ncbi:MAG TPA: hypothetical protein EYG73_12925 [Arcobacter sp.]|nr:hypothetical protein [Arcobacter sp.]